MRIGDVRIFDDIYSFLHALLGFIAALIGDAGASVSITIVYTAYQVLDRDYAPEQLGDLVEYAAGFIAGLLVRAFIRV